MYLRTVSQGALAVLYTAFHVVMLVCQSAQSIAATNVTKSQDEILDPAMQELFAILDEKTEIATHTKINIDFVPGMVTVLHGKDLLARGVRTVVDALSYVPGIELSSNTTGQKLVIVRGVGRTLGTGKIKVLLDGVALNSTLQAASLPMILPIQFVDRVEMIRGPGSAIYGEFASVGVLNIVTRKTDNKVFFGISDESRTSVGAQEHFGAEGVGIDLRFSFDENKGGRVTAGNDILKSSPLPQFQVVSNSPGPINDAARRTYISLSSEINRFQIQWQRLEHAFGDYFGASNALPRDSDKLLRSFVTQNIHISNKTRVTDTITANSNFGWQRSVLKSRQHELFPPNAPKLQPDPVVGLFDPSKFVDGVLGGPHYEEDKYYFQAETNIITELNHDLLVGVELSQVDQGETFAHRNYQFKDGSFGEIPNQRYTGNNNWLREGLQRRLLALFFQDQYALSDKLHLTTGIRYDRYDDIGSDVTPRIASVYQLDHYKTLKIQFAQSFRPPVFIEMYSQNNPVVNGNPDLKSERLNTFEVGYTYNNNRTIARATFYYYKIRDIIVNDPLTSEYGNLDEVVAEGAEWEFNREINQKLKIEFTMSFVDAHDKTDNHLPDIAKLITATEVFYTPMPDWSVSVRLKTESDRGRAPGDPRAPLKGSNIVDLTLLADDVVFKGLTLTASIYNVFDANVKHPAPRTKFGLFDLFTYEDDYPQLGREFAVSLQYKFR